MHLEPPRTSVRARCTHYFFCEDVVREGSVESKLSEPMRKNSTHLVISARCGSRRFEEVRCALTTPN